MTLHLLALPHTKVTPEYSTCAYTQKVLKFCRMMHGQDDEPIVLYGPEGSEAPCSEFVQTVSHDEQLRWFGEWDPAQLPEIDWTPNCEWWRVSNNRAAREIQERAEPGDLVLLTSSSQAMVGTQTREKCIAVEWAVGYDDVLTGPRIWESYPWMHYVMGRRYEGFGSADDSVVPNFFDPDEFPTYRRPGEARRGDYLLWVGRWVPAKGPHIAVKIAEDVGVPLILAGPGYDGSPLGANAEHAGPVGIAKRAELMAGAIATLVPTLNVEPFGGVAVESMMAGTPAVTTDWGAFTETVPSQWRFRRVSEGAKIVSGIASWNGYRCRDMAREAAAPFTLAAVRPRFRDAFYRVREASPRVHPISP